MLENMVFTDLDIKPINMSQDNTFYKPDVWFPRFPLIHNWIKADYARVVTEDDFIKFIHKGLNEIEISKNEIRKNAYKQIIYPLYSKVTGTSYESLINI